MSQIDDYDYASQPCGVYVWEGPDKKQRFGVFRSHYGLVRCTAWSERVRESAVMDAVTRGWTLYMEFVWDGRTYTRRVKRQRAFSDLSISIQASKFVTGIFND